jgi:LysM repeat protein
MLVKKSFMIVVALALLFGVVAVPAATPAQAGQCTQTYTVKAGDTLNSIAIAYGVTWPQLAKINKIPKPYTIFAGQTLCISTVKNNTGGTGGGTGGGTNQGSYSGFPTFSITGVSRNTNVTIQTSNLPPNDTFNVTMGAFGTKGIGGILVDTVNSGSGGSKTYTFNIPAALVGSNRIAIRMESPTSGFFAYNWFWNSNAGSGTGGGTDGGTTSGTSYSGIPTFSISSVVRNGSVTIHGNNFPANDSFTVTMGPMGTRGVGGYVVQTYNSGAGGSFNATFAIPSQLYNSSQISIRLESPTSGYFAYNWFWNNNAP